MILEHEILEQFADDERDFAFALLIFGGDLERLKRVVVASERWIDRNLSS